MPDDTPLPRPRWRRWLLVAALFAAFWLWQSRDSGGPPEVDYSTVYGWIDDGKVLSVELSGRTLDGLLVPPQPLGDRTFVAFQTVVPEDPSLIPLLHARGVHIRAADESVSWIGQLAIALLPWALIIGIGVWMTRRAQRVMIAGGGGGGIAAFLKRGKRFDKAEHTGVTFADVAGATHAKRDLEEVVQFLREPKRFERLGGRVPRGVLLVGPPGTGKTLLARAVAGEADVAFFSITGAEFIEMFVGVGAARVRELFEDAKRNAPAIVFIDELDAVGRVRGAGYGGGHDEREQTLDQLLAEMDGFVRSDLVVVIAATNRPDVLDPALLRPGRFDRRVVVDLPERPSRREILVVHTRGKPLTDRVDLEELARMTVGFSGADLANLVNEAALHATRRRADTIDRTDFVAAYDKIVLGDPRESRLRPDEKTRIAIHESGHALLAWATPGAEAPRRCSILPRGMALGATQQAVPEDRHVLSSAELRAHLAVLLGGYAAERIILGDVSTGAEDDLRKATALASKMVAHYGMSSLGPVYYEYQEEHAFLGHRIATEATTGAATVDTIEREARGILATALDVAEKAVATFGAELERLRAALIERETLEHDDLERLLPPRSQAA